jgi:O-antigen/teichoic acid export membrane protein
MGTGVNAQIISTSTRWRFELQSGIFLLIIMLPLTYILTKSYGLIGPAIATLISISIYNIIRILFLWKKFRLFPFTKHTLQTILLATACYGICWLAFRNMHGFAAMFIRSIVFIILYAAGTIYMKLSPDIDPVLKAIKGRLGLRKS